MKHTNMRSLSLSLSLSLFIASELRLLRSPPANSHTSPSRTQPHTTRTLRPTLPK